MTTSHYKPGQQMRETDDVFTEIDDKIGTGEDKSNSRNISGVKADDSHKVIMGTVKREVRKRRFNVKLSE